MSFYTEQELSTLGFASLGKDVQISRKASFYGTKHISIGDNSRIDDFCIISAGEKGISIGRFAHISCHTSIIGKERIEIGDFVAISSHSSVYSSSDDYSGASLTNPTIFIEKYRNVDYRPVRIGRHVVIGAHSCVLPGVEIGDGAALGAHSLATENIEENKIAVGVPCRVIKERKKDYLELEKKFLAEACY